MSAVISSLLFLSAFWKIGRPSVALSKINSSGFSVYNFATFHSTIFSLLISVFHFRISCACSDVDFDAVFIFPVHTFTMLSVSGIDAGQLTGTEIFPKILLSSVTLLLSDFMEGIIKFHFQSLGILLLLDTLFSRCIGVFEATSSTFLSSSSLSRASSVAHQRTQSAFQIVPLFLS